MRWAVLVRYSGEVTLKANPVRVQWERRLIGNILGRLKKLGVPVEGVRKKGGRIFIYSPDVKKAAEETAKVFGTVEANPAIEVEPSLDAISEAAISVLKGVLSEGMSFAVRSRRVKQFPVTSREINAEVGRRILEEFSGVKVSLDNPDIEVFIEGRESAAYVYVEKFKGVGGLPYGVSGKGVALISGGVDSAVAAWLMMRRGMEIVAVHYDLTPFYGEDAKERAMKVLKWLAGWIIPRKLKTYIVPFGKVHQKYTPPSEKFRCVMCKMLMLKIAEEIAKREGASAIVTGESLSQVASQTLENMLWISRATELPILRPVIWMDKDEIEKKAIEIGIYEITAKEVTACKLVPKKPATRVKEAIARSLLNIAEHEFICSLVDESEVLELEGEI